MQTLIGMGQTPRSAGQSVSKHNRGSCAGIDETRNSNF